MPTSAGIDTLDELLIGPTAIAFVEGDAAAVAKALRDYARVNPALVVKGGLLGEQRAHGRTRSLPSPTCRAREVLLAQLAGALQAPIAQFAGLLAALPRNFAYGLKALIDQQGGVPAEDARHRPSEPEAPVAEAPAASRRSRTRGRPSPRLTTEAAAETETPAPEATHRAAEHTATEETE